MRALVTGCMGFVGRHTIDYLGGLDWDTVGIDIADRSSPDALDFFRRSNGSAHYDLVVHAAASAPHRAAIDHEHQHMARNLQLDAAMFEWAVRTEQGRVIYLSSSAVYPIAYQARDAYREPLYESMVDFSGEDVGMPDSVYGWAKLTGERMAAEARRAGLPVTVVRPFSGYGADQSPDFPFRAILDRVKRQENPVAVWGDGSQVRDWIHISDVVAGMLAVAENGTEKPVNLCTGIGHSMFELALMAARRAEHHAAVTAVPGKPAGVAYRVGDPSLFHSIYRPKIDLEEGVVRALRA